jgi:hypothetical protein
MAKKLRGIHAQDFALVLEMMELFKKLGLESDNVPVNSSIDQYIEELKSCFSDTHLCQMEQCQKKRNKLSLFCQVHMSQFICQNKTTEEGNTISEVVRALYESDRLQEQEWHKERTSQLGQGADDSPLIDYLAYPDMPFRNHPFIDYEATEKTENHDDNDTDLMSLSDLEDEDFAKLFDK